ncbi:MAG TPA: SRPBCC domain-containing protein [Candidatus Dormibacteraeota bacterium]|nr:SRPBCC domain-containing protein [Candidatus Dormibacteraeota bacterium]
MAGPLMHTVEIDADANKIYDALSTSQGLASFWTADSHAEPKVGSIAKFGFHGPVLEMTVDELTPGKRVRWSTLGGFPEWKGTTVTWDIKPAKNGGNEVTFNHDGWPEALPPADLASVNYAWGRIVGRLKKYAETGKPVPYFP